MKPLICEFSYGYGYTLTEEIIRPNKFFINAALVLPSLVREGRQDGYDVQISFNKKAPVYKVCKGALVLILAF